MRRFWGLLLRDETGATMLEYVVMAAMIGAALAGVVGALGQLVGTKFGPATDALK